jgi:hypothetical protein
MKTNWQGLAGDSHLNTVLAIKKSIQMNEIQEAVEGLDELYESMARTEKRDAKSQLKRLMLHILKWNNQPEKRSISWIVSINNARQEIADAKEASPGVVNDSFLKEIWERTFEQAVDLAKSEMQMTKQQKFSPDILAWEAVFEAEYFLENE